MIGSLLGNRGGAGHIFVRGISARSDESDLQFCGPAILYNFILEFGDWSSKIWCERPVDMRLQFRQILEEAKISYSGPPVESDLQYL